MLYLILLAAPCADHVEVLSAAVTYKTALIEGRPIRRDATIDVTLRSTSTSAVTAIELGVFLGAPLEAVSGTRPMTLPTHRYREFEAGGLAFRAEVSAILQPGQTAKVAVERRALPLGEDVYAVSVVPAACKTLVPVGVVQIEIPATEAAGPPGILLVSVLIVGLGIVYMVFRQLR